MLKIIHQVTLTLIEYSPVSVIHLYSHAVFFARNTLSDTVRRTKASLAYSILLDSRCIVVLNDLVNVFPRELLFPTINLHTTLIQALLCHTKVLVEARRRSPKHHEISRRGCTAILVPTAVPVVAVA